MTEENTSPSEIVNVRFSTSLRGVKAVAVPGIMLAIKGLLSEWGEAEVSANITYPRKPLTMADVRRAAG